MKPHSSIALCGALWSFCAAAPALAQAEVAAPGEPSGVLARLTFAAESATRDLARDPGELGATIAWASDHADGMIIVDGHADATGTPARAARIALARAKAVRGALIAAGVNPDQIVIAAFGDGARRDRSVVIWGTRAVAAR